MIQRYELKDGSVRYRTIAYVGKDSSNKAIRIKRSGFKTRKEAQITEARILAHPEEYTTKKATHTYRDVYDVWIAQYENSVRESTLQATLTIFKLHVLPVFGERPIADIQPIEIEQLINEWSSKYVQYKRMANYTKAIFEKAFKLDLLAYNPFDKVDIPHVKHKPKNNEFYTKDQLQVFLAGAKDRGLKWYALFRLLSFSGIRQGECLALTWSDINLKKQTLDVNKTVTRGLNNEIIVQPPKTDSSCRIITLDEQTISILKSWKLEQMERTLKLGLRNDDGIQLMFPVEYTNKHMTTSQIRRHLIAIQENTGLPKYSCHKLRHTHTSLMIENGAPIERVMKRLGHDSAEMTNYYTHVDTRKLHDDIDDFANYLEG